MRFKSVLVFVAAVGVSSAAATHRFKDSGHAIGLLRTDGGKVRHAVELDPGKRQYVVVVTGTVVPPYRGDARVVVEGGPDLDYEILAAEPAIDLGIRRRPRLVGDVLQGLEAKDRFALWVLLRPHGAEGAAEGDAAPAGNAVAFYDVATGKPLLRVPILYHSDETACHVEQE